ncbi:MAG: UPF0104 family protein [Cyanobacteriota bacterium]|nr:UPF0104 family protein [Cyanobacteriota bacterium]
MKCIVSKLKPYLRWVILGTTLFFLAATLRQHWQEAASIRIGVRGIVLLGFAFAATLFAQTWAGWVWGWILKDFNQPVNMTWATRTFLTTNIAKYLPGNVWHFYQRIVATRDTEIAMEAATLSVILEPLLMMASALPIAMLGIESGGRELQFLSFAIVAICIHPRIINPVAQYLGRVKAKTFATQTNSPRCHIRRYPLRPWLGELGFVTCRGIGFVLILAALGLFDPQNVLLPLGAFSLAWVLGLIVPGAPGGMGVFEATALGILEPHFPDQTGTLLVALALYRVTSILAETGGAGLAWLDEYWRA